LLERRIPMWRLVRQDRLMDAARAAVVFGAVVAVIGVVITPLGFGLDYRDQSGNSKVGVPLSNEVIERLRDIQHQSGTLVLINLRYWDAYPSVFTLQQSGVASLALLPTPTYDEKQKAFYKVLQSKSFFGVCQPRFGSCVPEFGNILTQRGISGMEVTERERFFEASGRVITVLQVRRFD